MLLVATIMHRFMSTDKMEVKDASIPSDVFGGRGRWFMGIACFLHAPCEVMMCSEKPSLFLSDSMSLNMGIFRDFPMIRSLSA